MNIIAQLVGFAGIAANMIIYQQKTRRQLLAWKFCSDVLWGLHYILVGGYTGAAISLIAMLRELVFMDRRHKWTQSRWTFVFFLGVAVAAAVLTWKNIFSLLPMIASIIAVTGFWMGNPRLSRILSFPVSACMLTYGVSVASLATVCNEVLTIISSVIGIFRHDRKK